MTFVEEFTLQVTLRCDRETAEKLRETLEAAAACLFDPTDETAKATFRLGANAIYRVAERNRQTLTEQKRRPPGMDRRVGYPRTSDGADGP